MGIISKITTIAFTLGGVALVSQLPEFAQQYRQRLGGAVTELKLIVEEFDKDANASSMSREQALAELRASPERFPRDRGNAMGRTINRFDGLSSQQMNMERGGAIARPVHVIRYPDKIILNEAWEVFEPAVPLNPHGALYGGIGGIIGWLLARIGIGSTRRLRRNRNDRKLGVKKSKGKKKHGLLVNVETQEEADLHMGRAGAGLLDAPVVQQSSLLADVTFDQRYRGEVNMHGNVVDLNK